MFLPNVLLESYYYISQSREEMTETILIGFYFIYFIYYAETGDAPTKTSRPKQMKKSRSNDTLYKPNYNPAKGSASKRTITASSQTDEDEDDYIIFENKKYFQLFDIQWCKEYLNTCISLLYTINKTKSNFSVKRLGTFIDEHFFSKSRMNCHGINTYENFCDVFDRMIYALESNKELSGSRSHARFRPVMIPSNPLRHGISSAIIKRSRIIAEYLFCQVAGEKQRIDKMKLVKDTQFSVTNQTFAYFKAKILELQRRSDASNQNHQLSSSESVLRPNRTAAIYARF